jgi:putative Holliday junction resolvase
VTAVVSGTLLAFDFGERRIGVAVGETSTAIASPLTAIVATANDARFAAIEALVTRMAPGGLRRRASAACRRFAASHRRARFEVRPPARGALCPSGFLRGRDA